MTTTRRSQQRGESRRRLAVVFLVSLVAHALFVAAVGPNLLEPAEPVEPPDDGEFVVETMYEEVEPPPEEDEKEEVAEVVEEPVPVVPPPLPDTPDAPEEEEIREQEAEFVEQENNEEMPEEAEMIAAAANVASEPAPEIEQPEAPPPPSAVEPTEEETAELVDPVIRQQKPAPSELFFPDMKAYDQVFESADESVARRAENIERSNKPRLMPGYEQLTESVKTALGSHGHAVRPGNHQGVNALPGARSYIGAIHRKIHFRWASSYLMDLDLHERAGSPMNDPELNTTLEFVIRSADGTVEDVRIVRGSGQVRFDAQAIAIAYQIGPHPRPPAEIVSPNGKVYIHWNFWRDQRQCGLFGASVYIVDTDEG